MQRMLALMQVLDKKGPHKQVFFHAHGPEDTASFRRLGNTKAHDLMALVFAQVLAVKHDGSLGCIHQAADGKESGALACAVGAKQGHYLALMHMQ